MKQAIKKTLMVAGVVGTVGLSSLGAASFASAASSSTDTTSSTGTSIVDKLVAKFGLSKTDVQAVFDADRAEHEAQHLTNLQDKLASLVEDGSITQDQSDAILAKYKENVAARSADTTDMSTLTDAERKAKMDEMRADFDEWVTSSGIPEQYARLAMGGGRDHGGFGHGGPGGDMAPTSSSSSSSSTSTTTAPTTTTN